jgi:hypothetical protein
MYAYNLNKVISIGLPVVGIGIVTALTTVPTSWSLLLILVTLLGYTHHILGLAYQRRAWRSKPNYHRYLGVVVVMGISSGLLVYYAMVTAWLWLVALFTIPYFVWHGYENEHTLFTRATGQSLCPWLLGGISITAVGLTIDSFRHASALFASDLSYRQPLLTSIDNSLYMSLAPYIGIFGLVCIVCGGLSILYSYYRQPRTSTLLWFLGLVLLAVWFFYASPLPYVWLFVFLLGYHFITWGIHYGTVFWYKDKNQFWRYIGEHILVIGFVLVTSVFLAMVVPQLSLGLLNTEVFLAVTIMHITTSFLNDTWLQTALRL